MSVCFSARLSAQIHMFHCAHPSPAKKVTLHRRGLLPTTGKRLVVLLQGFFLCKPDPVTLELSGIVTYSFTPSVMHLDDHKQLKSSDAKCSWLNTFKTACLPRVCICCSTSFQRWACLNAVQKHLGTLDLSVGPFTEALRRLMPFSA